MDDCAGLVQCISLECSLVSQSHLDPNKAAELWGHALFLPEELERSDGGGNGQKKKQHKHKMPNNSASQM